MHIISFDVPYPPNYGGVIDIYYKIKALHQMGIKIHLHCYAYGREKNIRLNELCEEVFYYQRRTGIKYSLTRLPYIVATRASRNLFHQLLKNDYPILFEGLHSTYFINSPQLKGRQMIVRTHNVEHEYYNCLSETEKKYFKKTYFRIEARKLKSYEQTLSNAGVIAAISKNDHKYFSRHFSGGVIYLPAFHPYDEVKSTEGLGDYIIYHGNLSVGENVKACLFQIQEVFRHLNYKIIIAGRKPDKSIVEEIKKYDHMELISNPQNSVMNELIANAQINVLTTFQDTGLKLKLLAALFNGRHCLVNSIMVRNTGMENLCNIKDDPKDIIREIHRLFPVPFEKSQIEKRKEILLKHYSNRANAKILVRLL